jgi:hypothetical protein
LEVSTRISPVPRPIYANLLYFLPYSLGGISDRTRPFNIPRPYSKSRYGGVTAVDMYLNPRAYRMRRPAPHAHTPDPKAHTLYIVTYTGSRVYSD